LSDTKIRLVDGSFHVIGKLSFASVVNLYKESMPLINNHQDLLFDFSQVTSSDSSGLALIIEWIKLAKKQSKPIKFHHISDDLMSLAKASSLDKIISL
jgi:phospholipid transport system transporter-binding protein